MQNFLILTLFGLTGFFTPLLNRLDSGPENRNNSSPRNTTSNERSKTTKDIPTFSTKRFRNFGFDLGKISDYKSSSHHSTATKVITRPSAAPHHTNGQNKPEGWREFGKKHREKLYRGWKELKDKFRFNKVNNSSHDSNKREKFNEHENRQTSTHDIRDKSVQDRTVSGFHQTRLNSAHTTKMMKQERTYIQTPSTHRSVNGAHQTRLNSAHMTEATKHNQTHIQTGSTHQPFHYSTEFKRKINLTDHGLRGDVQYESSMNFSLRYGRRGATVYQNKINLTASTTYQATHVTRESLRAGQSTSKKTDEVHRTTRLTPTDEVFKHNHTDPQRKQTKDDHSTAKLYNKTNEDKHQITTRAQEPDKQTLHHETKMVPKVESPEVLRAKEKYFQAKKEMENLMSEHKRNNNSLWIEGRYSELLKSQRLIDEKRLDVQEKQTEWERLRKE